jgi:hypothetical protein
MIRSKSIRAYKALHQQFGCFAMPAASLHVSSELFAGNHALDPAQTAMQQQVFLVLW